MSDLKPCPFCGEAPSIMSVGMAGQPRWQHPVNDTCPIAGHYLGGWDFPVQWNQRALPAVQPDADELVGHMTKLIAAGLDRVEQLTAELASADAMIEAQAKDHASNNIRFAEATHRAEVAEAEIARLQAQVRFLERKVVT